MKTFQLSENAIENFEKVINGTYTGNGNRPYYACGIPYEYEAIGGYDGSGKTTHQNLSLTPTKDGDFLFRIIRVMKHGGNHKFILEEKVKTIEDIKNLVKESYSIR